MFLPAGFAQTKAPQQTPLNPGTATCEVSGQVVDAASGQPLRKISLHLYPTGTQGSTAITVRTNGMVNGPPRSYAARSDATGQFAFPSLPPGEYRLQGYGNDYPTQMYGQRDRYGPPKPLKLTPGQNLQNIRFPLEPGVVITGRVLDEDGDPVTRAFVSALREQHFSGRVSYNRLGNAQTDDLGQYRIFALPAGRYYVGASFQMHASSPASVVYAPEYYPGTTDPSQATAINAKPGDTESGIDITLTPVEPARLSGQVIGGGAGGDLRRPGPFVFLLPSNSAGPYAALGLVAQSTVRDVQGDFEIDNVPPGSYRLVAQSFARRGRTGALIAELPVELASGQNLSGLQLTLTPGVAVSGTVTADPSPGFDLGSVVVRLISDSQNPLGGRPGGRVSRDGKFVLQNVYPGKYQLSVTPLAAPYYLKSATFNGADALDSGLTVPAGMTSGTLAISLGLDGGTLTGSVTGQDNKSAVDASVVLIPDPPRRDRDDLYKVTHTNAMGMFSLEGIAPGTYKVFSWENVENEEYKDPDFMKQYEDQGQSVEVKQNSQQSVQLQVIPQTAAPAD
ncbi:MAG TPA: carboxypeptidase-like regulatory domain-containing protein [Terriglobia bacterium]|nr:carboxypeptidase-like regulatory domain-containing protein [Terriglobia bacterium]